MLHRATNDTLELVRLIDHFRIVSQFGGELLTNDVDQLCELAKKVCPDSIFSAVRAGNPSVIAFKVRHGKKGSVQHNYARQIGTYDFCWLVLMLIAGCRLVMVRAGVDPYSYLRVEHPDDISKRMRVRLKRIIMDAPANQQVAFRMRKTFRIYLRSNLKLRAPSRRADAKPKLGRADAILLAKSLYEQDPPTELAYLSAEAFEQMLRDMLVVADNAAQEGFDPDATDHPTREDSADGGGALA